MKNVVFPLSVVIFGAALLGLSSCQKEEIAPINSTTTASLSSAEVDDLSFLIQEEKLARDVYIYAYQKHGDEIFNNITTSEQSHMNQVAALLDKYNVPNPVIGLAIGQFQNASLQQLYYDLVAIADSSSIHGFKVGATIEDLDIHDIENQYANTNNVDLITTYDRMTCGSRNHMRSFYSQLQVNGVDYVAQFISQDQLNAIISTDKENCNN